MMLVFVAKGLVISLIVIEGKILIQAVIELYTVLKSMQVDTFVFTDFQRRSMKMLSIALPLPSMLIFIGLSRSERRLMYS